MIKLTYKEAKDACITDSIEKMKEIPIPAKISWRLMKIHRKLTSEFKGMEDVLRTEWKKHVVKDEKGEIVPVLEEKDEKGVVTKPGKAYSYIEGGKAAHEKSFQELIKTEFTIDEAPVDISQILADDRSIPIECMAGLEPLTIEYQKDREAVSAEEAREKAKAEMLAKANLSNDQAAS